MELVSRIFLTLAVFFCGASTCFRFMVPLYGTSPSNSIRHTTLGRTPLDEWSARRRDLWQYNTQHETDIQAPGWIRTHNPSKRATADLPLRLHGHWDWPHQRITQINWGPEAEFFVHSFFVSHIAFPAPLWFLTSTCNQNTSSPHALRPWRWRQKVSLKYRWRNPQTMPDRKSMSALTSGFWYCRQMGLCLSIKSQK